MTSQLVCRPERDLPVAVLRVRGRLDRHTAHALRIAVRRCLAPQPEALLVDLTGADLAEPAALEVIPHVITETAEWPNVPVIVCGHNLDHPLVGYADSLAEAMTEIADEPEPRRIRVRLKPVPDACRQVRQLVHQACVAWHAGEAAASASLVATELVANVVRHAHTTMEFTLGLRDNRLCLTVRDGSRRLPRAVDPTLTETGGRGLRLVRALTESWGVHPFTDGKVVWTHLGVA
ncbi:ATP-binding protein [Actinoplanes sp. NPDC049265]|uniref:ATP-binding protein n=1 Tax=Actinoplanes sp. NPDC049265 TaxID=3363902 RepID=UPI003721B2D5